MNTITRINSENNNSTKGNVLATSISVVPSSLVVPEGATTTFNAILKPSNVTNPIVKWISSNTNVVTVDLNTGVAVAVGVGTATITAVSHDGSNLRDSATVTVRPVVTVISNIKSTWIESSSTMGYDMAGAMGRNNSYRIVTPTNASEFATVWNNSSTCVVIHTHGEPNKLANQYEDNTQPDIITIGEIQNMNSNYDIDFVMITACMTAGGNEHNNIAYWLSKKINPMGIVIANKENVTGGSKSFCATGNVHGWVIYRNGAIIKTPEEMPITLTMATAKSEYDSVR